MATPSPAPRLRIAVIGHAEHVTIGRLPALPVEGDIAHLDAPEVIAGGGGAIAFGQLARSAGDVHFLTALGNDDAAAVVRGNLGALGSSVHAAERDEAHTRDLVIITPDGERTIFVVGEPLHPAIDDPLPWDLLSSCDAAYFTGQDPRTLAAARDARLLVVTARRGEALALSGVRADIVIGSRRDPRETSTLADYAEPPVALVMTEGTAGGSVESADGIARFAATPVARVTGAYGAGDTFAAAVTWYVARGVSVLEACERAAIHAAAILGGTNPIAGQLELA